MSAASRKEQLQALLRDDPHDPFLRYGLALELDGEGDTPAAISQLLALLQDSPEYIPGFLQAGQLLIKVGQAEDARETLRMGMQAAFKQADHHAYEEMEGLLASLN